jgi:hypothetical protein
MVQDAVARSSLGDWNEFQEALAHILEEELWKALFDSFPEFCIAPPPDGLGLHNMGGLMPLRRALLALEKWHLWSELLERVATKPGNPNLTLAQSDGSRFYRVPTSYTSTDRILLALKSKHPNLLEEVCTFAITAREAALELGWIKIPRANRRQFLDDAAALNPSDQVILLRQFFDAVSLEARSSFLAGLDLRGAEQARQHDPAGDLMQCPDQKCRDQ